MYVVHHYTLVWHHRVSDLEMEIPKDFCKEMVILTLEIELVAYNH